MSNTSFFLYLSIMVLSTYFIRAIPFALIRDKIENQFIQSFLTYIPYTVLTAMTIPAVIYATNHVLSALCGLIVAILLALKGKSLTIVALLSCLSVFIVELFV